MKLPLPAPAVLAAMLVLPCVATARGGDRHGRAEIFAIAKYAGGDDTTTSTLFFREQAELDAALLFGLGVGYNFTSHVNVNATVIAGESDWQFSLDDVSTGKESSPLIQLLGNADWNILDAPVTPFLTAGAGVIMFPDSSLIGAGDFNYGIGAGIRWDFAEHAFLKVWYRADWFGLASADDGLQLHTFNVGIGFMR